MDEMVAWLTAYLDEIERVAKSAQPAPWTTSTQDVGWNYPEIEDAAGDAVVVTDGGCYPPEQPTADHIALHDPRSVLARVEAERAILAMHGPTRGYRGEMVGDDLVYTRSDDPADLTYPEAAALCRTCGPGDNWRAAQEPYGELPCAHLRWLAYGHRFDVPGWREEWAPEGARATK